ncbi:MAG: hypothetical protein WCE64_14185 [Bacteroidales bacterium]
MNEIKLSLKTLLFTHDEKEGAATVIPGDKEYVDRVLNAPL